MPPPPLSSRTNAHKARAAMPLLLLLAGAALVVLLVSLVLGQLAPTYAMRAALIAIGNAARLAALLFAGLHLNALAAGHMRTWHGSTATPTATAIASGFLFAQTFPAFSPGVFAGAIAVSAVSFMTLMVRSRLYWRKQAHRITGPESRG